MIGHLLGAAGAVEFITCVKELEEGGHSPQLLVMRHRTDEMDLN